MPVCCAYLSKTSNFAPNQTSPSTQRRRSRPSSKQKSTEKLTPKNPSTSFPLSSKDSPHGPPSPAQLSSDLPCTQLKAIYSIKCHRTHHSTSQQLVSSSQWLVAIGQSKRTNLSLTFSRLMALCSRGVVIHLLAMLFSGLLSAQ